MILLSVALAVQGQALTELEKATQRQPNASHYRALASAYVRAELYEKAAGAFYRASALYGKLGDPNAAKFLKTEAERYETKIELFVERPAPKPTGELALFEPANGCYLGAFIEREDALGPTKDPAKFDDLTGKHHAVFFTYLTYGRPFPRRWTDNLRRNGAAAHIAFEPHSVAEVHDDAYLRSFARDCASAKLPIFLRFAAEMNGDWVPYHGDPAAYRRMFQLVALVMHEDAPNVAMVWCPGDIPERTIPDYYPGREAVDWVGVNFYSVLYNDADPNRTAAWRNPLDSVKFIYDTYSAAHPIMVGEWAATHLSVVDRKPQPGFAVEKIGHFYAGVPRLYPRIKCIDWLSMNTIEHAMPGRKLNDFSLLDDASVREKYREMVQPPYFLEAVESHPSAPISYVRLTPGMALSGHVKLSAVVKTYEQRPMVSWNSGPGITETGAYETTMDLSQIHAPQTTISLTANDSKGRVAGRRSVTVKIAP